MQNKKEKKQILFCLYSISLILIAYEELIPYK